MAIGILALQYVNMRLPLKVCKSHNGFFLGTEHEGEPISRESVQYWKTAEEAQEALKTAEWDQRLHP
jgi:hypothetical protein